jgi:hypothetical protein
MPLRARNVLLPAGKQLLSASRLLVEAPWRLIASVLRLDGGGMRKECRWDASGVLEAGCERVEAGVPVAGRMGVEDPTERDVPFVSCELVTEGGTAVVSSGEAAVVEAVVGSEEKEQVGVVDKGPSSLSGVVVSNTVYVLVADSYCKLL